VVLGRILRHHAAHELSVHAGLLNSGQGRVVPASSDEALRQWLGGASIETAIQDVSRIEQECAALARGTECFVPWLPSMPYHHLVTVSARLTGANLVPVPHIAARRLADAGSAQDLFARLHGEAGVERVLLVGGDVERPAGPYAEVADLLATGVLQASGIRRVGLAGYPEGHPTVPDATLKATLSRKLVLAHEAGLDAFVVSQFCFEAQHILDWVRTLRSEGVQVPLRIGLAAPAKLRTLIAYGARCGVGGSLRAIKSQGLSLTRLVSTTGPEPILAALSRTPLDAGVGLHFFSFGGVESTARWMRALERP
jgi:methylenetetrahydrofolate reductase (NADPH)